MQQEYNLIIEKTDAQQSASFENRPWDQLDEGGVVRSKSCLAIHTGGGERERDINGIKKRGSINNK